MSEDCNPAVEMRGIVKVYPDGVRALDGVDFTLMRGEVHALLGENGAGKTTLMRILYGEIRPSQGEIRVCGERVHFRGTRDAIRRGIALVYQHPRLVPTLTVWENIMLYLHQAGVPPGEAEERVRGAMRLTGFEVPLDETVEDLPLGTLQRAEIVKALAAGARILGLDEPTTNLTPLEVEGLFQAIRRMREQGISLVYITHKLREVEEIADTVTVLRKGRVVASRVDPRGMSREELARLMVGELPPPGERPEKTLGSPVLEVEGLRVTGRVRLQIDRLEVRAGEIVGVAGVEGNGQEELVEAVVGLVEPEEGVVRVLGLENPGARDFLSGGGGFVPGGRPSSSASPWRRTWRSSSTPTQAPQC